MNHPLFDKLQALASAQDGEPEIAFEDQPESLPEEPPGFWDDLNAAPVKAAVSVPKAKVDHLAGLNEQQRAAASTVEGPILILAGAGSGKTRVIIFRIAHLIETIGVRPDNILAVTFTNKAAGEMKARIEKLLAGNSKVSSPLLSTFHSLCVRILRREIDKLERGYTRSFTIYDSDDQQRLLKQCIRDCGFDDKTLTPRQANSAISGAKNRSESPELYAAKAEYSDPKREMIARVYALYEQRLQASNALDFDDLLIRTVQLLRHSEPVRTYYHNRFRHVMVDEFQDTNGIQYNLTRLLVEGNHALLHDRKPDDFWRNRSLCVVGDVDQCLPAGARILTPRGYRPVEELRKGETVVAAGGHGRTLTAQVGRIKRKGYAGRLIEIQTTSGTQVKATPNHILFGKVRPLPNKHLVYLMYREGKGYRIGRAQGARKGTKDRPDELGLQVRSNQEHADKMWLLKVCDTKAEAAFCEALYAARYGIPTMIFHLWGRGEMNVTQAQIDRLVAEIDTQTRVQQLFQDFNLFENYPHFRPKSRIEANRLIVNLTMFGDSRTSAQSPWGGHRIQFSTSDQTIRPRFEQGGFSSRPGKRRTWRTESARVNYAEACEIAEQMKRLDPRMDVRRKAMLVEAVTAFHEFPASHFQPGMSIAVYKCGVIEEELVTSVKASDYQGTVYDLDILQLHNFISEGIVCHNSIYGWRGSDFNIILHFERDFPGTKTIKLEDNYRSTANILDTANKVIAHNTQRFDKVLRANAAQGEKIKYAQLLDGENEARWVIGKIEDHLLREPKLRAAVLYRTNAQSRLFEEVCRRAGLRYNLVGGFSFYERAEVKDVIAYLKLAMNPNDSIALLRVVNTPTRGIGKTTLDDVERRAKDFSVTHWETLNLIVDQTLLPARTVASLKSFRDIINGLTEKAKDQAEPLSEVVKAAVIDTGYERALKEENSEEAEARLLNLEELVNAAVESEQRGESLRDFLDHAALVADTDQYKAEAQVTLMTMHAAKGLEFPLVFIAGLEENLFPHSRVRESETELEEERRLCYVAITRAEKYLYLTHAQKRRVYGEEMPAEPSRFLNEFPHDLIEDLSKGSSWLRFAGQPRAQRESHTLRTLTATPYPSAPPKRTSNFQGKTYNSADSVKEFFAKQGKTVDESALPKEANQPEARSRSSFRANQRVRHAKYGQGLIVKVEGEGDDAKLTINFPGYGHKKLMAKFAGLEKI